MLTTGNAARIPLADGVVHACVTSPPYFRQRRYGVVCDWPAITFKPSPYLAERWHVEPWRGEMGWEPHVLDYIGHLVLVYRGVYRCLRDDGQNWINISDKRTASREWFRVPEMLVDALVADGWRHEDTVIWHKPSAMPGSQQNRFTRDFEYIYRLNKSRDDFFDIDAVREPLAPVSQQQIRLAQRGAFISATGAKDTYNQQASGHFGADGPGGAHRGAAMNPAGRTRRTVWTVNPEGLNLPHYAAYPRELVRVMLKASVSERGACPVCGVPWGRMVERTFRPSSDDPSVTKGSGDKGLDESSGWANFPRGSTAVSTTGWRPTCTCQGAPSRGPVRCGKCRGTGRETALQAAGDTDSAYQQGTNANRLALLRQAARKAGQEYDSSFQGVETGNPCPHCDSGTVEGDVWPADVDTWPVSASIVLDPFVGSGTTAVVCEELRQKGTPVVCVGLDLNHHYLADLARERLGLLALEAWEEGRDGGNGRGLEGLPLFRALEVVGDG